VTRDGTERQRKSPAIQITLTINGLTVFLARCQTPGHKNGKPNN
jgi:hypothetical protein